MFSLLIVFLINSNVQSVVGTNVLLKIRDGFIRGEKYVGQNNTEYYGFRGIPYARPPVGVLRFEDPNPSDPWLGIRDATKDSKACISAFHIFKREIESEDCLYINVYTPSLEYHNLPVMFWIYGGDFVSGNSTKDAYGPDFLMTEQVILVTFNYRLGPFGFLSTGDDVMPGNYGLKDQNLALQWTQQNIKYFGGDPTKVTIFGQSAGGASVALHILSEKSKGLFRAAIIESASALVPWILTSNPKDYALQLAQRAGYNGNSSKKVKMFLKLKLAEEIVDSTDWIKLNWPVLEVKHPNAFISDYNYQLLDSGKFNQVPTIMGICSEESLGFLIDPAIAKLEALVFDMNPLLLIPKNLYENSNISEKVAMKIKEIYIDRNQTFFMNVGQYAEYITDTMFARGVLKHAQLQSKFTPVYLYEFSYYGRPLTDAFIEGVGKAGHTAEIPFIFKLSNYVFNDTNTYNVVVQNKLVKMWTNFAKYLDPTPEGSETLDGILWSKFDSNKLNYLDVNERLELKSNLKNVVYSKWNEIFAEYGKKPFVTY